MKRVDLERILAKHGYILVRAAGHRIWSNGKKSIPVPHGREINKMLTKRIFKEMDEA